MDQRLLIAQGYSARLALTQAPDKDLLRLQCARHCSGPQATAVHRTDQVPAEMVLIPMEKTSSIQMEKYDTG